MSAGAPRAPTTAVAAPAGAAETRLGGARLFALPSGALYWPERRLLAAADLHLGKAARAARAGGALAPPYETAETLARLERDVAALEPAVVALLGDSFDAPASAAQLDAEARARLAALAAGRRWVWIAGNHDPAPPADLAGETCARLVLDGVAMLHAARPGPPADGASAELSGHLHPKAELALRGRRVRRRCFLTDGRRMILPAYGAYAGGLDARDPAFDALLGAEATALLLGRQVVAAPRAALSPRGAA